MEQMYFVVTQNNKPVAVFDPDHGEAAGIYAKVERFGWEVLDIVEVPLNPRIDMIEAELRPYRIEKSDTHIAVVETSFPIACQILKDPGCAVVIWAHDISEAWAIAAGMAATK